MKGDYKKVDQLAQQAIAALRGMQKRSQEEKQRREALEARENNAKGIDIDLIKEWIAVRRSTVHLFASMNDSAAGRRGRASGYDFTVRSFPWIIAGHELWHREIIERLYLGVPKT